MIDKYFSTARERYRIHLGQRAGDPWPWTADPVFREFRFCNTHRELDKTTVWFRENVRHRHPEDLYRTTLNTVIFRWFNRIETGEALLQRGLFDRWDAKEAEGLLRDVRPVVTGAYMINTPPGMNKLDGVIYLIEEARKTLPDLVRGWQRLQVPYLETACYDLMTIRRLAGFTAHQVVADLKYTPVLGDARDRLTWAYPGPGTLRGAGRLVAGDPTVFRDSTKDRPRVLEILRTTQRASTGEGSWPADWPRWEMSDISNWFCEFDKYCRAEEGGRMKRKYQPCT